MIHWTDEALEHYLAEDPGGPVVMLNLLRFQPDGGRESYRAYTEHLGALGARFGLEVVYAGDGATPLVAEADQDWDTVALVRYPSRASFAAMVRSDEYRSGEHLRTAALAETVLQPTAPYS